jgi:hypothetical protein
MSLKTLACNFAPLALIRQLYFASRLDIPHYHVAAQQLPSYLRSISSLKRIDLVVSHIKTHSDLEGPHLNVYNKLTREMKKIVETLPLLELADAVLASEQKDKARGNRCIDVGFAGDKNTKRSDEWGGVAVPNPLKDNGRPIFVKALVAMTEMLDLACQPSLRGKVFVDPLREKLFAGKLAPGNRIEALRVALSNEDNMVLPHVDSHNDVSENFQGVINYSCWLQQSTGKWWRLSIIGYSRKACAGSIRRRDLYMPLVERIVYFYNQLPEERKSITPQLLDFQSHDQKNTTDPAKRLKPHSNKCVFYGIYVDCVNKLHVKFGLSTWHLLALLINTVASESPDFFVVTTNYFLSLEGKKAARVGLLSYVDFACLFYDRLFDDKEKRHHSASSKTPGQRHQPHYNTRQPRSVVVASIHNFIRLYKACALLDSKLASDPHYYARAVATLVERHEDNGVYGAGALTAQHLIHIAVLCGFLPPQLICHAEIGENTCSYSYLARWEGLVEHQEDTRQLLACLGKMLGVSAFIAENIVCKFGQSQQSKGVQPPTPKQVPNKPVHLQTVRLKKRKRKTSDNAASAWANPKPNRYRDSIYPGQSLYEFDGKFNLVETTLAGQKVVGTLASRCSVEPQPKLPEETFGFWMAKMKRGLIPLKEGTRNHLQKLKGAKVDGYDQVPTSKKTLKKGRAPEDDKEESIGGAPLKPRIRIRVPVGDQVAKSRRKNRTKYEVLDKTGQPMPEIVPPRGRRSKKPNEDPPSRSGTRKRLMAPAPIRLPVDDQMARRKRRRTTRSAAHAIYDDSDVDEVEDEIGVVMPEIILPPRRISKKQDADPPSMSGRSKPSTATSPIGLPVEDRVAFILSVPTVLRRPLPLLHFAMSALSLPKYKKKFLQFAQFHHTTVEGSRRVTKLAASFMCPAGGGNTSSWSPPSDIGQDIVGTFFRKSVLSSDGIRYHESKSQAMLYCFMAAILNGDESLLIDAIRSTKLLQGSFEQPLVLYDNQGLVSNDRSRTPFAVLTKDLSGFIHFSFVDERGSFVGRQISFSS